MSLCPSFFLFSISPFFYCLSMKLSSISSFFLIFSLLLHRYFLFCLLLRWGCVRAQIVEHSNIIVIRVSFSDLMSRLLLSFFVLPFLSPQSENPLQTFPRRVITLIPRLFRAPNSYNVVHLLSFLSSSPGLLVKWFWIRRWKNFKRGNFNLPSLLMLAYTFSN